MVADGDGVVNILAVAEGDTIRKATFSSSS